MGGFTLDKEDKKGGFLHLEKRIMEIAGYTVDMKLLIFCLEK